MTTTAEPQVSRTTVENHSWLLPLFGGARLGPVLLWAGVWVTVLARVGKRAALGATASAVVLLLGAAYWTFAEYAVHRWFYQFTAPRHSVRRIVAARRS